VSYFTLQRLSKKCNVAKKPHQLAIIWGRCLQAQHSKAVARRLTAMPEVLPVQFMQMLCSNGVKLLRDLAVADECNGNHEQRCANDPHGRAHVANSLFSQS